MKHEKRGAETMTVNYHRGGMLRVGKGGKITMCSGFYVHIYFLIYTSDVQRATSVKLLKTCQRLWLTFNISVLKHDPLQ